MRQNQCVVIVRPYLRLKRKEERRNTVGPGPIGICSGPRCPGDFRAGTKKSKTGAVTVIHVTARISAVRFQATCHRLE